MFLSRLHFQFRIAIVLPFWSGHRAFIWHRCSCRPVLLVGLVLVLLAATVAAAVAVAVVAAVVVAVAVAVVVVAVAVAVLLVCV